MLGVRERRARLFVWLVEEHVEQCDACVPHLTLFLLACSPRLWCPAPFELSDLSEEREVLIPVLGCDAKRLSHAYAILGVHRVELVRALDRKQSRDAPDPHPIEALCGTKNAPDHAIRHIALERDGSMSGPIFCG